MEECCVNQDFNYFVKEVDRLDSIVRNVRLKRDGNGDSTKPNTGIPSSFLDLKLPERDTSQYDIEDGLGIDENLLESSCWLLDDKQGELGPNSDANAPFQWNLPDADINDIIKSVKEPVIRQLPFAISTKTYARSKKGRSSLGNVSSTTCGEKESPKLRRRLTTTIEPSPALIPHLEKLSRTNNRPLSNCDELNWEDGAHQGEAPAELPDSTPVRTVIPDSLYQRLQQLKQTCNTRPQLSQSPPFAGINSSLAVPHPTANFSLSSSHMSSATTRQFMSTSQVMRLANGAEMDEPESYLSLGNASLLGFSHGDHTALLAAMGDSMQSNRRLTFGGVELQPGRGLIDENQTFVKVEELLDLNKTYDKEEEENSKMYITNPVYDKQTGSGDENRNTESSKIRKGYTSALFDQTFQRNDENVKNHDGTFSLQPEIILNGKNSSPIKLNSTYEANGTHTQMLTRTENSAFTRIEQKVTQSEFKLTSSRENLIEANTYSSATSSREELNEPKPQQYSTATYSRPSARFSPIKSGLPKRCVGGSPARSPARSDGTITPVELRAAHGTYTRNSPVEDEQMSTASDHSARSQDSIDELPERVIKATPSGKRQISTPRVSAGSVVLEEWQMSPITHYHPSNMSPASSNEKLSSAGGMRLLNKVPHGPVPLKPALIRPTENFKRPSTKKNDVNTTAISSKVPVKPPALNSAPASGLPKPPGRTIPTRIPTGRVSSIPKPPSLSARLGTTHSKD